MNYGEAATAITIAIDVGHLFKKFYRGFEADILTWLPYDEDENNELVFPFKFWFESGCSDETTATIFNSFIKPCVLPAEFCHGHGKMSTYSFLLGNLPTYEFYNPSFVARQFGLSQLPLAIFQRHIEIERKHQWGNGSFQSFPVRIKSSFSLSSWMDQSHLHFKLIWFLVARMALPSLLYASPS